MKKFDGNPVCVNLGCGVTVKMRQDLGERDLTFFQDEYVRDGVLIPARTIKFGTTGTQVLKDFLNKYLEENK